MTTQVPDFYLVLGDCGDEFDFDGHEAYNDAAFAWKQADERQAEADRNDEAVVYGVYVLTVVERL